MSGQQHAPAVLNPRKDPVPIVQEAGWIPGPVWTGGENLASPPGFDPRTVQTVASRYNDSATWPTLIAVSSNYLNLAAKENEGRRNFVRRVFGVLRPYSSPFFFFLEISFDIFP